MKNHSTTLPIWLQLRHPLVRSLAWCCFSPAAIRDFSAIKTGIHAAEFELTPARSAWLQGLDENPARLEQFCQAVLHRPLGLQFEACWQFFLQEDDQVELLAHNLAVRDEQRTLGEFDILYYCKQRKQAVHLELAVKFYLGLALKPATSPGCPANKPTDSLWQQWIGPNQQDRLDLKLDALLNRQLQLGEQAAARSVLDALGIHQLQRECRLSAYSFYPVDNIHQTASTLVAPQHFATSALRGRWLTASACSLPANNNDSLCYHPLHKQQWLTPQRLDHSDQTESLYHWQKVADLTATDRPQQWAVLERKENHWLERERLFVVPDDWV